MKISFVFLLVLCLLGFPVFLYAGESEKSEALRSRLYPKGWYPGYRDEEGRFLHDFSYAGYHRGERPIPDEIDGPVVDVTEEPFGADPTGDKDTTEAIQLALDAVGLYGGGVVYLPEGTYRLRPQGNNDYALQIRYSNVVLRGAGADRTFLFNDETYMRGRDIISVRPQSSQPSVRSGSWNIKDGSEVLITKDLMEPTTLIPVEDPSVFEPGDWVVIYSEVTEEFIAEHDMSEWWDPLIGNSGPSFYRKVLEVREEDGFLVVDIPTRYRLKIRDKARVFKAEPPLEEIGVEDLAIGNRESEAQGWGHDEYTESGTGAYEVHGSYSIRFRSVVNSWARRIKTYKPEVNDNYHILSNGITVYATRNVSVVDSDLKKPQYRGGGGNGYLYRIDGNDNLFKDCTATEGRHNVSLSGFQSNGNVIYRALSREPSLVLDFHMYLSMANLLDGTVLDGDMIESTVRPYGTVLHGVTSSESVIYNTEGKTPFRDRGFVVDSRQHGYGYVIGTRGEVTRVRTWPTAVRGRETAPEDFVEAEGEGDRLKPQSLYADQLERRSERSPVELLWMTIGGEPPAGFQPGRREYRLDSEPGEIMATPRDPGAELTIDTEGNRKVLRVENEEKTAEYLLYFAGDSR